MTEALPELATLPAGLVLDGELVAFNKAGDPHFPLLCRRMLNYDRTVPVRLMIFDVLRVDGENTAVLSYAKRRARLDLGLTAERATRCNLLEDRVCAPEPLCDGALEIPYHPFENITLRVE